MQLHVGKASGKLALAFPQTLPHTTHPLVDVPLYSLAIINLRHGCMLSPVSLPIQLSTQQLDLEALHHNLPLWKFRNCVYLAVLWKDLRT